MALTIAGSDSGGGAGIQADLKTFHTFRVFGTSVITATTAQNTLGVTDVHPIPLHHVDAQLEAVATDLTPSAVKTGMLATAALVEGVARGIRRHGLGNYVLDPVMVASSGDRLLAADAEAAVLRELVPLATLVTPNLHEAEVLLGREVQTPAQMALASRELVEAGARAALVKGGHLEGEEVVDILWDGREERVWRRPRLKSRNTHGTGCTLSAAVAAGLARGWALTVAVDRALDYLARAIATAPDLGKGHGPVNHFAPLDGAP
ncbi:MAG: bifunctional hydroxymethylpyrimidine kinase/phosphomethylpyrimidine kinase [Gemmatimonadota bacterium]